ncbi:MAG: GAF domain-containing protein [Saprospiraceae bacterium]|nr:GAF domain-containing protein [Saprospiraceae bacterium]
MSATQEMPYFIKPSINLTTNKKRAAYEQASLGIDANLIKESNLILKMVTINCILKTYLPYYYWVGFYIVNNGRLSVGPYQGTLGCLHIDFSKGVCGRAAREEKTQIVKDVHLLNKDKAHIACDPNSQSEIVVPVFDKDKNLIAVFDVDSTLKNSFDAIDQFFLETIIKKHFTN